MSVVIEIPRGSCTKYQCLDPEAQPLSYTIDRKVDIPFPQSYGFIPGTVGGDGDPADAFVIATTGAENTHYTGEIIPDQSLVRVGIIHLLDGGMVDDKLLYYNSVKPVEELAHQDYKRIMFGVECILTFLRCYKAKPLEINPITNVQLELHPAIDRGIKAW